MKDLIKKYEKFATRNIKNVNTFTDYNQLRNTNYTAKLNFLADDVQFLNADKTITKTEYGAWAEVCASTVSTHEDFNDYGADWVKLHIAPTQDVKFYHFMFDLENEEEKEQFKNFLFDFFNWFVCI